MNPVFWWLRQVIFILCACFFLVFGIQILISAYTLQDPFSFVMTFFASNLMILISATLVFSFIYQMVAVYRVRSGKTERTEDHPDENP